jgi:hypothetical protein
MFTSPQTPIYAAGTSAKRHVQIAGVVAAVVAVVFVGVAIRMAVHEPARSQAVAGSIAAIWLVGAPLWFWWEYFFIYRAEGGGQNGSFEYFKQGQQVAASIWAGLAAALGAFAVSDYAKPRSDVYECQFTVPAPQFPASQAAEGAHVIVPLQNAQLKCKRAAA